MVTQQLVRLFAPPKTEGQVPAANVKDIVEHALNYEAMRSFHPELEISPVIAPAIAPVIAAALAPAIAPAATPAKDPPTMATANRAPDRETVHACHLTLSMTSWDRTT